MRTPSLRCLGNYYYYYYYYYYPSVDPKQQGGIHVCLCQCLCAYVWVCVSVCVCVCFALCLFKRPLKRHTQCEKQIFLNCALQWRKTLLQPHELLLVVVADLARVAQNVTQLIIDWFHELEKISTTSTTKPQFAFLYCMHILNYYLQTEISSIVRYFCTNMN